MPDPVAAAADAARVAALARTLIDLLDRTALAFDDLAALAPGAVACDLTRSGHAVREIRARFAGPPRPGGFAD